MRDAALTFNCTRVPQYAHLYSSAIRSRSRRSCFCSCSCFCSSPRLVSPRLFPPRRAPPRPDLASPRPASLYLASPSLASLQPRQRSWDAYASSPVNFSPPRKLRLLTSEMTIENPLTRPTRVSQSPWKIDTSITNYNDNKLGCTKIGNSYLQSMEQLWNIRIEILERNMKKEN